MVTLGSAGRANPSLSEAQGPSLAKGKSGRITNPFEALIGTDDRIRVDDTAGYPWRMICALRMTNASGSEFVGTGWLIGPRTVITAGHCVYSMRDYGGWAQSIRVVPGRNGSGDGSEPYGSTVSSRFDAHERWIEFTDPEYDIGCIHLDDDLGSEVGWFAAGTLPAEELASYLVNVSGYPLDRGLGAEQLHHRNRVVGVQGRRLFYEVDTMGGQSGAPVWIHEDELAPPLVIGIHAYGTGGGPDTLTSQGNSGPCILEDVYALFTEWIEKDSRAQPVDFAAEEEGPATATARPAKGRAAGAAAPPGRPG